MARAYPSAVAIVAAASTTRGPPTIGASATRTLRVSSRAQAAVDGRAEVQQVGGRRCVDGDQPGEAHQHQLAVAQVNVRDGCGGHLRECVEQGSLFSHVDHPFSSFSSCWMGFPGPAGSLLARGLIGQLAWERRRVGGSSWAIALGPHRRNAAGCRDSRQQLRLALRELVVTDDALVAKISQSGDLVRRART